MKILIVRHGESADDILNAYGGWANFLLTKKGKEQIKSTAVEISSLPHKFELVISSPLSRAVTSAKIIASEINVPLEILEYVKERNTYGVLSGMNRDDAKKKYPDQVQALANGDYVDGSERIEDMRERVKIAYKKILEKGIENIVLVTHGNFLRFFFEEVFDRVLVNKEDAGYILIEINGSDCNVILSKGIDIGRE